MPAVVTTPTMTSAPTRPATPASPLPRKAVAFVLVAVVIVVAVVAAAVGIAMSAGGIPSTLANAARSTLALNSYSADVSVTSTQADDLGSSAPSSPAVQSSFEGTLRYQGASSGTAAQARLTTVTGHVTTTKTGSGSTVVTRTTATLGTLTSTHTVPDAAATVASTVTQYLHAILGASSAEQTGATYHLNVAATAVPQPGLSEYARRFGRAQVAVTLGNGYVHSIVVEVLSPPSSQTQMVTITPGG